MYRGVPFVHSEKTYDESNGNTIEVLSGDELEVLEKFISVPLILFNGEEVFYINESCINMLGYEKEGLSKYEELNPLDFFEKGSFTTSIQSVLENDISFVKEKVFMINKNIEKLDVELNGKIVIYESKKCILASLKDITYLGVLESDLSRVSKLRTLMVEITRVNLKAEDVNELFQFILDNALKSITNGTVGTIMKKEGNRFKVASHIGYSDVVNEFSVSIADSFLYRATEGKMDRIANVTDLIFYENFYPIKLIDGEERYIKSTLTAPIYLNGNLFGMINIDSDETNAFDDDDVRTMEFIRNYVEIILSNYLLYEEKLYSSKHDHLTNFYNRHYFEEQSEILMKSALDFNRSFKLVVFDINDLKVVNDTYGHLAGDEAIKKIANELKNNIRNTDIIWRLGGDEFAGVFFDSDKQSLHKKFQSIISKLEGEPLFINGNQIECNFSYGIADFPEDGASFNDLIKVADKRMYDFKENCKCKE